MNDGRRVYEDRGGWEEEEEILGRRKRGRIGRVGDDWMIRIVG
jgi:hypothetical protein